MWWSRLIWQDASHEGWKCEFDSHTITPLTQVYEEAETKADVDQETGQAQERSLLERIRFGSEEVIEFEREQLKNDDVVSSGVMVAQPR